MSIVPIVSWLGISAVGAGFATAVVRENRRTAKVPEPEQECYVNEDCESGRCNNGRCVLCEFGSDCPPTSLCYKESCEPRDNGVQLCLDRFPYMKISEVEILNTDFGDQDPGTKVCFFFLGSEERAIYTETFEAKWTDIRQPTGGYLFSWGPTSVSYGRKNQVKFEENSTFVPYDQYLKDGGFGKQQGGSVPCSIERRRMAKTSFYVEALALVHRAEEVSFERDDRKIHVSWERQPESEVYYVYAKVGRVQNWLNSDKNEAFQFPETYAYHGKHVSDDNGTTEYMSTVLELPEFSFNNKEFVSYYSSSVVKVVGYKYCNLGSKAFTTAGELLHE